MRQRALFSGILLLLCALTLSNCGGGASDPNSSSPSSSGGPTESSSQLSVSLAGVGAGTVTSDPPGIDCGSSCSASFTNGTAVTLTATAKDGGSVFAAWSGACSGKGVCTISVNGTNQITATFNASLASIHHIIFLAQENRSFDHYFGHLPDYWRANGYPAQALDVLPSDASNPSADGGSTLNAYHLVTQCVESPNPSWNESHRNFNLNDPTSTTPTLDGFVYTAAQWAQKLGYYDSQGVRAMGYYTGDDLVYYYFMASKFATSDRWFSPLMTRTQPNRMYLMAATSAGYAAGYTIGNGAPPLPNKTIFQLLDEHGITWKIYVSDYVNGSPATYLTMFTYDSAPHTKNVVPISEYFTDVANGSLPQVAMIEGGYPSGRDEHPADSDAVASGDIQIGAKYVASIINALMSSPSWHDSAFILTFDEAGGFYDHVAPRPTVSPDGIPPQDLQAGDVCTTGGEASPICDFKYTGYRVPLIVLSPFTKKNYVSHTTADYTAILKFIEKRFKLPSLTARDAAQMDMTEFFDFAKEGWVNPPKPPQQPTNSPCYLNHLP